MKLRLPLALAAASLALVPASLAAAAAMHPELSAKLTPGAEMMMKGPTKAHGIVNLTIQASKGRVCWSFDVGGVVKPTSAQIHRALAGHDGPVAVSLGRGYSAKGCGRAATRTLEAIEAHPNSYYVNVDASKFPEGAVRGQLVVGMMHM